jgi:hypothetical protein
LRLRGGFLKREREDKQRNSRTTIGLWSCNKNASSEITQNHQTHCVIQPHHLHNTTAKGTKIQPAGTKNTAAKHNTNLSPPPPKQNQIHHHHQNKTRPVTTTIETEANPTPPPPNRDHQNAPNLRPKTKNQISGTPKMEPPTTTSAYCTTF